MSTAKGTRFETSLIPLLNEYWPDTVRLGKQGVNDKGDFHMPGNNSPLWGYIVEAKNCKVIEFAKWRKESEREAQNKGVPYSIIVHKRRAFGQASDQWVTTTLGDFFGIVEASRGR